MTRLTNKQYEVLQFISGRDYVERSKFCSHFILMELLSHKFIEEWYGSSKRKYKITDAGKEYLNTYNTNKE